MYDVVVVGAGPAGCVAARRLAGSGRRVALVEAGPGLPEPWSLTTADAVAALGEPAWFWPGLRAVSGAGREVHYRLGRGVGGGSAVNTLVVMPGDRAGYDRWEAELGCPGWRWATMEPWFELATAELRPATAELGPLAGALRSAAEQAGHPAAGTSLDPDRRGFMAATVTVAADRRRSAVAAYLVGAPPELEVRAGVGARRVLHRDGSATGVELDDGTVLGAGLVVVGAGALHTPALLGASGLWPSQERSGPAAAGRWEAPVEDHPAFTFPVALRPGARQRSDRPAVPISGVLRWASGEQAAAGVGADLVALVMDHVGVGDQGRRYGAVIVMLAEVSSTGRVAGAGGRSGVVFDPGWLRSDDDRRRLRAGVRHAGALLATDAIADVAEGVFLDDRGTPLTSLSAMPDAELDRWLVAHPGPVSHAAASCRLGQVLGLDGQLLGCERLHVVDASVFPHLPNANPQLPVLAVAERLAAGLATSAW
jgi:choline dehydrogenase-like flavoprotein